MKFVDVERLRRIAEVEFSDIVLDGLYVVESHLDQNPERALREFLTFARDRLG